MQRLKAFGLALLAVLVVQAASFTPNLQSTAMPPGTMLSAGIGLRGLPTETHFAEFLIGAGAGALAGLSLRHRLVRSRFRASGTALPIRAASLGKA